MNKTLVEIMKVMSLREVDVCVSDVCRMRSNSATLYLLLTSFTYVKKVITKMRRVSLKIEIHFRQILKDYFGLIKCNNLK